MSGPTHEVRLEVLDTDGSRVVATEARWAHIIRRHPELVAMEEAVGQAIAAPSVRMAGRDEGEAWFYLELGPAAVAPWLKVVVCYKEGGGQVITAFLRRSVP